MEVYIETDTTVTRDRELWGVSVSLVAATGLAIMWLCSIGSLRRGGDLRFCFSPRRSLEVTFKFVPPS